MDRKAFKHMRSLARIISDTKMGPPPDEEVKKKREQFFKALEKMKDALKNGEPTRMRRYFALLHLEDWWYLVFGTYKRRGAYLFLRLLNDYTLEQLMKGPILWRELKDPQRWKQAELDSDNEPDEPGNCTDTDTNIIENEDTPGTSGDGW